MAHCDDIRFALGAYVLCSGNWFFTVPCMSLSLSCSLCQVKKNGLELSFSLSASPKLISIYRIYSD